MNPSAYGTWNGQKVVLGTGESLLDPTVGWEAMSVYNRANLGKCPPVERQSEGVVVVRGRESRPHGEGPLLHRCARGEEGF